MVVMVLATLVLSGAVSLLLAQRSTVTQTRRELVREATGLAASVQQQTSAQKDPATALRRLLIALRPELRLDGSAVVGVASNGTLFGLAPLTRKPSLPAGVDAAMLQPGRLYGLATVSGRTGSLVFAAVPYQARIQILNSPRDVVQAVVITRRPPSALATAGPWFGASALVILAVAALVAWRLGRRFSEPIRAAQAVAGRVAAGDLEARVPEPAGGDSELAGLAASINAMTESLARAKAAERHFLQSVSHDLRTPLTSIRGYAEALEDGTAGDTAAAAAVIASESRRLERLVGDLLALAALEARRFTLRMTTVDLADLAAGTVAGFGPAAAGLGLRLESRTTGPVTVTADADRLGQVVANLVDNALRYARSTVTVGVAAGGSAPAGGPAAPVLWVDDDGPGIAGSDLPRVFDRLYRSRSHPDGSPPGRPIGSGLGLTIVAELVAAMGGTVRAESPLGPDGGTRMVVSLRPG
jgi:signal transduction histidine kinase